MSVDAPLLRQPSDILAHISAYLHYDDILNLYCTNNHKLMLLLTKNQSVRSLSLEYKAESGNERRWPTLQTKLPMLTEFVVTTRFPSTDRAGAMIHPTWQQISALPKSLTSLKFCFGNAESCLAILMEDTTLIRRTDVTPSFAECFPSLLHLHLEGTQAIQDANCKNLPSSLLSLTLLNNTILTNKAIAMLPASITALSLPKNHNINFEALERLTLLTSLHISGHAVKSGSMTKDTLFATLAELEMQNNRRLQASDLIYLPSSLTSLNLRMNNTLGADGLTRLPESLLTLTWGSNVLDTDIKKLPKALTALTLVLCKSLSDECIANLPRTLTHLDLWSNKLSDKCISLLPRGLKVLYLASDALSDECATFFPSNGLLQLKLNFSPFSDKFLIGLNQPYLRRLELNASTDISDKGLAHLPKLLNFAHFVSTRQATPACIPTLPPYLRVLNLLRSEGFSEVKREDLPKSLVQFLTIDFSLTPQIF